MDNLIEASSSISSNRTDSRSERWGSPTGAPRPQPLGELPPHRPPAATDDHPAVLTTSTRCSRPSASTHSRRSHRDDELIWELSALHQHWLNGYHPDASLSAPQRRHHDFALADRARASAWRTARVAGGLVGQLGMVYPARLASPARVSRVRRRPGRGPAHAPGAHRTTPRFRLGLARVSVKHPAFGVRVTVVCMRSWPSGCTSRSCARNFSATTERPRFHRWGRGADPLVPPR